MNTEQVHDAVSDAERALQSATERLASAAHSAVDTLSDYSGRAEDRVRNTTRIASERSREYLDQIRDYVEAHPVAAIGIAAAVGFAFGILMRPSAPREPSSNAS
jgi:ElaB/YqjD/DUF883 family membrane-anchored ribosome-binding protein